MLTTSDLTRFCRAHQACTPALEWLATLPEEAAAREAWERCERADWMLWLVGHLATDDSSAAIASLLCRLYRLVAWTTPAEFVGLGHRIVAGVEGWCRDEVNQRRVSSLYSEAFGRLGWGDEIVETGYLQPWLGHGEMMGGAIDVATYAAQMVLQGPSPRLWEVALAAVGAVEAEEDQRRIMAEACELVRSEVTWEAVEGAVAAWVEGQRVGRAA